MSGFLCRYIFFLLLIVSCVPAYGQLTLQGAEYFWDVDPGEGMATAMTASDGSFDESFEIAVEAALASPPSDGVHLFGVRMMDFNGNWGPVYKQVVAVTNNPRDIKITQAEYFWGFLDPGEGMALQMVAFDGAFDQAIETAFSNGLTSPGIDTVLFNIRVKDEDGNWGPLFKRVVYNDLPPNFMDVTVLNPVDSICLGDSLQIVASGAISYNWSPSGSLSASTGDTVWASPEVTTTYYISGTNSLGNVDIDTLTIFVVNPPNATIPALDSIYCSTSLPVTLTGIPSGGTFTGAIISGNIFDPVIEGVGIHSVTYTVANAFGCIDDTTQLVSVQDLGTSSSIIQVACDNYTAPSGAVFTSSGIYVDIIPNAAGCDSTITIDLTVNSTSYSTITETACLSYNAPSGAVYTSSGTYIDTIPNALGCDSIITINLVINTNTSATITEVACDFYTAPSGAIFNSSGTHIDVIPNAVGCDSIITIALTILNGTSSLVTEVACDSFTVNGQTYTTTGIYSQVQTNSVGCDSTITIDLTIYTTTNIMNVVACDSFALNGETFTSSGTYIQNFPGAAMLGCDSAIVINASINSTTYATVTEYSCETYIAPSGEVYFSSGTYSDTILNSSGCDSIITINLTINNETASSISVASCNSYTAPSGAVYTTSGTYTDVISNAAGCDSTITIVLAIGTVNTFSSITEVACDLYTAPSGAIFTSSGTYIDVIPNAAGCDSIITIDLTINSSSVFTLIQAACYSYTVNGQTYTSSGIYEQTLVNSVGCDSILTLELTINTADSVLDVISCNSYSINGQTYTSSGTYTQTLFNGSGCDSIITLNLTIGTTPTFATINEVVCNSYTAPSGAVYTSSGTYTDVIPNSVGCDSTITINLTINDSIETVLNEVVCVGYTLNGVTYTSTGVYTQNLTTVNGCDSIITLNLLINVNDTTIDVSACNSYTFNGQTYTSSGIYTQTLSNSSGCDSTVTVNLTIGSGAIYDSIAETVCATYTAPSGTQYTSSGMYNDTVLSSSGCDSIITIDLTVIGASYYTDVVAACDSYTWIDGVTYTNNNDTSTVTLTGVNGCDSIIQLDLTIDTTSFTYLTIVAIDLYTINGDVLTASGVYQQILSSAAGCDSVLIIDLTIEHTGIEEQTSSDLVLVPNPTNGLVKLLGINALDQIKSISVVDTKGTMVAKLYGPSNIIDLSEFSNGMYYIRVEHAKGEEIIKIVRH